MLKSSNHYLKPFRITVCGFEGVGKTSIIENLVYGHSPEKYQFNPSVDDVYNAQVDTERGTKERVQIFDTAGLNSANYDVPRAYMPYTDAFVLVYAVNNAESFNLIELLKKDIEKAKEKKELNFLIIGNKTDLLQREVDYNYAKNWAAREKVSLIELSALNRKALIDAFVQLVSRLAPHSSKSTFSHLSGRRQGRPLSTMLGGSSHDIN